MRGGYDFAGSNSSIDLHALTGWIPEQVGFQHAGFQREKMWNKIKGDYDKGHLMITAGTTKEMKKRQLPGQVDLIDSHNYAVLDLQEDNGERWLILMNPWEIGSSREIIKMSWNEACARLDSLYINWSPNLFRYSLTWHGIWRSGSMRSSSVQVVASELCDVWLLLIRHITTSKADSTEWIALHVFGSHDERTVQRSGLYVDSSHTLLKIQVKPGARRITASRQGETGQATFTMFAYSLNPISLQDIPTTAYPHLYPIKGQWTRKTAGGNATHSTFLHNPQYAITVSTRANLSIVVESGRDIAVQIAMVWSRGNRIGQITQGDIVCSSGTYNYGLAMTEAKGVTKGLYTLIVSTFEAGQMGDFEVRLQSDQPTQIEAIPAEGAGMFHQRIRDGWQLESAQGGPKHTNYFSNPTFEIKLDRPSNLLLRLLVNEKTNKVRPHTNIAIFAKSSKREVVSSGPYSDPICGVVIEETRLEGGEYLVVVSTYDAGVQAYFTLDIYSDRRIVYQKVKR